MPLTSSVHQTIKGKVHVPMTGHTITRVRSSKSSEDFCCFGSSGALIVLVILVLCSSVVPVILEVVLEVVLVMVLEVIPEVIPEIVLVVVLFFLKFSLIFKDSPQDWTLWSPLHVQLAGLQWGTQVLNNAADQSPGWTTLHSKESSLEWVKLHRSQVLCFSRNCCTRVCSNFLQDDADSRWDWLKISSKVSRLYWQSSHAKLFLNIQSKFSLKMALSLQHHSGVICSMFEQKLLCKIKHA